MANSIMAYISFFLFSVFLFLSSHVVVTHELFQEEIISGNPSMVDDELEGSTNDDADDWVSYEVKSDFDSSNRHKYERLPNIGPRPWVERSDPWPGSASVKPPLRPRLKKNKNNNNTISRRSPSLFKP
ncbi:hypothetical protein PIB30_069279 [Stylosanthes scabra]|uniref:Uncharacterized protein n=1 Tax=Stylosanthes scabra TaxID=79078 RepID=A0ABU6XKY5_9FABA|nr:hypothetical protein [Stylosanthes scabra]